ncbi:MAG: Gfo/Idh/MocA family oxidoreductase [Phycisphaeraceae bacterium]
MSTTDTVSFGVVGTRGWGNQHLTDALRNPLVQLHAICDKDVDAARAFADKHQIEHVFGDYREMLDAADLDAISIATPHHLHHPIALAALNSGKHVFCEKPFTTAGRQARELVAAAEEAGVVLACDYNLRMNLGVRALRRLVAEGALGDVYHARGRFLARWTGFMFNPNSGWRSQPEQAGGGILIGRGSHMIDALLFMLGGPKVASVYARCHNRLTGFAVEDLASCTMTLASGASIDLEVSYVVHEPDHPDQSTWVLHGTEAGASFTNRGVVKDTGTLTVGRCDLNTGKWQPIDRSYPTEERPTTETLLSDFVESITTGRAPLAPGDQAATVLEVVEAAYASARSGEVVHLNR